MVLISRRDVMGKPSFSFSIFSRFRATISSVGSGRRAVSPTAGCVSPSPPALLAGDSSRLWGSIPTWGIRLSVALEALGSRQQTEAAARRAVWLGRAVSVWTSVRTPGHAPRVGLEHTASTPSTPQEKLPGPGDVTGDTQVLM